MTSTKATKSLEAVHTLNDLPAVGDEVATLVYGINGHEERASGVVVDHRRRAVIVATEYHGRIVVPADQIID